MSGVAETVQEERYRPGPAPSAVNTIEAGVQNLRDYGYTIHENFLAADEVKALHERLDEQAELEIASGVACFERVQGVGWQSLAEGGQITPSQTVDTLVNKGSIFLKTARKAEIQTYLQQLMPMTPTYLNAMFGFVIRNGARAQPIHVDQAMLGFQTPFPVAVHALLCLSDFDEDMGATRLIPGSHRWSLPRFELNQETGRFENPEQEETVGAVAGPGSLIMYDTRLWHGRGAHSSNKVRYSLSLGLNATWMAPFHNYPQMVHDDIYPTLDAGDLAFLGMAKPGTVGPRYPGDVRGAALGYDGTMGPSIYVPELGPKQSNDRIVITPSDA